MDFISKKDLLIQTGISYGQLYRWKRQKLIPEEWFMKQASYTGQETFFPREQILNRVHAILEAKDTYSLEELAHLLSPETAKNTYSEAVLASMEEIDKNLLPTYLSLKAGKPCLFYDAVWLACLTQTLKKQAVQGQQRLDFIQSSSKAALEQNTILTSYTVFQVQNTTHTVFHDEATNLRFDETIQMVDRRSLREMSEQLKLKYKETLIHTGKPE